MAVNPADARSNQRDTDPTWEALLDIGRAGAAKAGRKFARSLIAADQDSNGANEQSAQYRGPSSKARTITVSGSTAAKLAELASKDSRYPDEVVAEAIELLSELRRLGLRPRPIH